MYIISVVFLDVNYRIVSMQISELIVILTIMYDIFRHKFGIIINSLTVFMLTILGLFFLSDIIAILQGVYADSHFGNKVTLSYALGNCIRFMCIMYMVSKIIRELRDEDDIFSLIDWIGLGGQIVACVTILQVVFYMVGFTVSGVFYIAGMPRPKGLAHEPGPNAFVLLLPMVLSLFYVQKGKYKIHVTSLILHVIAFIFCLSSGAIPVFLVALLVFMFKSERGMTLQRKFFANMTMITIFMIIVLILCNMDDTAFAYMAGKFLAVFSDYANNTNHSGVGTFTVMLDYMLEHHSMFGMGAYNAPAFFYSQSSTLNCYIILFSDLGFLGMTVFVIFSLLFVWNYSRRLKKIKNSPFYANIFAYSFVVPIILAWGRYFNFHQIWIGLSLVYLKGLSPCRN